MKLRPLNNRIAVAELKPATVSKGGIALPDVAQEKSQRGRVVFTGPGRLDTSTGQRIPMAVKPGDYIMFLNHGRHEEVECDGTTLLFMTESEVMAVLDGVEEQSADQPHRADDGFTYEPAPITEG